MATTQAPTVKQAGALLTEVIAYCLEHPYGGEDLAIGDITFQQHYNDADGTRTVSVLGDAPDVIGVSTVLLEHGDPQFMTFRNGLLELNVQPRRLLYQPLYFGRSAEAVMFRRVCPRCLGRRKVPDWQNWNTEYGEPRPKPCPECSAEEG